jgi:hypothetical protein
MHDHSGLPKESFNLSTTERFVGCSCQAQPLHLEPEISSGEPTHFDGGPRVSTEFVRSR